MRRLLAVSTTVVLTLALAGATAAQEDSSDTAQAASEAPEEATTTQPLPTAEWGEWDVHRQAARNRIHTAATNADNAKAKKQAGFYQSLVGVYDDELRWLSNHVPGECIAEEVAAWRAEIEELQAMGKEAAAFAKKGNKGGLKKAAKRRAAARTELDALAFSDPPFECAHGEPAAEPPVLAGKWLAKPVYVEDGGLIDKSTRKLTIGDDGKMLLQVPGMQMCRDSGRGPVTLIVKGSGEVVTEGRPGFAWLRERVDCKRKGRGRAQLGGPGEEPSLLAYDPVADVLLQDGNAECYWRVDGGSKKDCQMYWQGTPPQPEEVDDPMDAEDMTEAEASEASDESAE